MVVQSAEVVLADDRCVIPADSFQGLQVFGSDSFGGDFQSIDFGFEVILFLWRNGKVFFTNKYSQKLDAFFCAFYNGFVKLQLQVVTQISCHLVQNAVCFFEIFAEYGEIVCITYISDPQVTDKLIEIVQIKVGKQRGEYGSLRHPGQ